MSRKCSKCGSEISETVKFCPECGTAQKSHKKGKSTSLPKKAKERKFTGHNLIYLVALFSVIVVGIYGYRFVAPREEHNHPENVNPTPQQPAFDQNMFNQLMARINEKPNGFEEHVDLGNFLFDSGKFEEAITYYEKALNINAKEADVLVDAGVSHFNLGRFKEAEGYFRKALAINDKHPNALYNLGVVSAQQGEMSVMLESWEKLIEIAPESGPAQTAKRMIDQVKESNQNN
jgi:tetratricopeptide (TPR) repeat protein